MITVLLSIGLTILLDLTILLNLIIRVLKTVLGASFRRAGFGHAIRSPDPLLGAQ